MCLEVGKNTLSLEVRQNNKKNKIVCLQLPTYPLKFSIRRFFFIILGSVFSPLLKGKFTMITENIGPNRHEQTVLTPLIWVYTVCHAVS